MNFSPFRLTIRTTLALTLGGLLPLCGQTAKQKKAPAIPFELPTATPPSALQVAPGFKVELLYTVPKAEQGSWVSLAVDPKGRLIAGDQYGGLYRISPSPIGSTEGTRIERLAVDFSTQLEKPAPGTKRAKGQPAQKIEVGAHGLLYANDSLYVMVNELPEKKGLWRIRDTNGDDQFDEVKFLREMKGGGEHGTHALVLAPDGKSIYFANGNHTDLPTNMEKSRPVAYGEDHLLRRMWDARGHAKDKYAPGGYIGRTDLEGKIIDLFCLGFRTQFDIACDQNGELFTYDSDMEWDQGAPWYMPTRINHAVDGGDYGWRSGAGRWPAHYADSLPAVVDIGPGCPTGITFGTNATFPGKYQRALFASDWTFGTLYAIHLTPDGASFRGEKEEFISGKPLPLTDVVINPRDGAMYFAVGGRRTQSALYRVTYVGGESTTPATPPPPTPEAKLRRTLEALHADGVGPEAIDTAWPHLASADRFVRFAARVAVERQPANQWAERALAEKNPQASIEALIALARVGDKALQPRLLEALGRLDFRRVPTALQLPLLRAWQLAFIRMGKPSAAVCAALADKFDPLFPHADRSVNRELVSLLVYLDSRKVVARAVPLLKVAEPAMIHPEELGGSGLIARNDSYGKIVEGVGSSRPDRQQIAYAYALRMATAGWTPELRAEFFSWFARINRWRGGASFTGFLQNIRMESLALVADPTERARLHVLSAAPPPASLATAVAPRGPGQAYTVASASALVSSGLKGRNFEQGKAMFAATACSTCHVFNGDGGNVGPDLTAAASRYSVRDLLENIIEPSLVISDQYGSEQIEVQDGSTVVGRIVSEEDGDLVVVTNPFVPAERTRVKRSTVVSRKPFPLSLMPPGLVNSLNEDELKDLLAYILSSGKADDARFKH